MKRKGRPSLTTKEFIEKAIMIHGDKYDYSKTEYILATKKILIICKKHGEFILLPNNHLRNKNKGGCPICANISMGIKHKINTNEYIKRCIKKHGNKFDYSKTEYKGCNNQVTIICKKHGEFKIKASRHLVGAGCTKCKLEKLSNDRKYAPEKWIEMSKKIHNNKYKYYDLNIKDGNSTISIICPIHGEFKQKIRIHVIGCGCKACSKTISNGEKKIISILRKNNIDFETQKTINGCKSKMLLRFDFYIPEKNIYIEYDGIQHFKPVNYFGGLKTFNKIKETDEIKSQFCKDNNINLLRISYKDDIEKSLKGILN